MAVDEALLETARRGTITIRFYGWAPGCLSLGRNQAARNRYDVEKLRALSIDVVRRPTGGRAVFHDREITYSVTAPVAGLGSLRSSYERINRALANGLRRLGVPASVASASGRGSAPRPSLRACFRDPMPGEVVADGRKLVGSAQWRDADALLQHGSILLFDDQSLTEEVRSASGPATAVEAACLASLLPAPPAPEVVIQHLREGFAEVFERVPEREELADEERNRASRLEDRYRDPRWTWRK